jgi:hypothetical protein
MRKALGRLVGLVLVMLAVMAGPAAAQALVGDSVTGTATGRFGLGTPVSFDIDARRGPNGESPTGQVTATNAPGGPIFFSGAVTCLNVQGNVALLKLQSTSGQVIGLLSMRITDNAGSAIPDLIESTFATGASNECASPEPSYILPITVTSGDIAVTDASLPTSKEQCKDGGWRNFGVFKNQGDCVSFVATGGKNPPANTS